MSNEILYPFQLDQNGNIATTSDPNVQAEQHVTSVIATGPGERVMLPTYGVPLAAFDFQNNQQTIDDDLINDIKAAISNWEPNVTVLDISDNPLNVNVGFSGVNVTFQLGNSVQSSTQGINTATVLVGGTVIDDDNEAANDE